MTHPRPIPKEALPVVHRLRLEVERPKHFPPLAAVNAEHLRRSWPAHLDDSLLALWRWGYQQQQTDPQAATDAIWPPDGRWCATCGARPVDPAMGTVPELYDCVDCDREVCGDCGEVEGDPDGHTGARCPVCREAA